MPQCAGLLLTLGLASQIEKIVSTQDSALKLHVSKQVWDEANLLDSGGGDGASHHTQRLRL